MTAEERLRQYKLLIDYYTLFRQRVITGEFDYCDKELREAFQTAGYPKPEPCITVGALFDRYDDLMGRLEKRIQRDRLRSENKKLNQSIDYIARLGCPYCGRRYCKRFQRTEAQ